MENVKPHKVIYTYICPVGTVESSVDTTVESAVVESVGDPSKSHELNICTLFL